MWLFCCFTQTRPRLRLESNRTLLPVPGSFLRGDFELVTTSQPPVSMRKCARSVEGQSIYACRFLRISFEVLCPMSASLWECTLDCWKVYLYGRTTRESRLCRSSTSPACSKTLSYCCLDKEHLYTFSRPRLRILTHFIHVS